ncbi:hypothetical protein CK203_059277 [Vitis vinifera]|uniref:Uncharacterized protein n=1 Tax=Vitis vinifera TaxID=29760 RepID=A0A438FSR4_VITVI|nr:hypothetical protein CK203_059277 [Vitis vinifera]
MKSQPNAKGEMYVLNEDIDMKAKVAAMARRLEDLEMKKVQEVQAISKTSVKIVGDFVGDQKSINAQLNQRFDSVESTLNKRMDEMQNDLSQKIDNVQYAISRLTNLKTVQEKGKFPSQPHQNPKGIHEVETQEGESSKVREVKAVITLRSGKEDLCTVKKGLNVNKKAFLTEQLGLGELKPTSITLSLADRSVKIPRGMIEHVLVQVDKFYYLVDFVVLDTDPVFKGTNYVPIILGRPFLATSNAIINCRNGVMQLTFGNMTLKLNIFHLYKKHIHPEEEEGPEEVCMIDTLMEEHCDKRMQEHLIESFGDLDEGLPEPSGLLATLPSWRRREEILPLFNEEETQRVAKEEPPKLILKPLPTKLKYAYLEEDKKCLVVISSALTIH